MEGTAKRETVEGDERGRDMSGGEGRAMQRLSIAINSPSYQIFIDPKPFYEVFDPSQIVYLSPDSDDELMDLEEDKVYVVGAIADHNQLKV